MDPIYYPALHELYLKQRAVFWTPDELNEELHHDRVHFREYFTDKERRFVEMVLAFFAASDGIVNRNLDDNFADEVQILEAKAFIHAQMAIEDIHAETYLRLLKNLVTEPARRSKLLSAIENFPSIRAKAKWAERWMQRDRPLAERIIAFACVEGIFFSAAFCSIFWIKSRKKGRMPALITSNEFISRDEGLHRNFGLLLYLLERDEYKPDAGQVQEIVMDAVECEAGFVHDILPEALPEMSAEAMVQYVQFCADHLLYSIGVPKVYNVENPFEFMHLISLERKTNFFEKAVSEYAKMGTHGDGTGEEALDFEGEDF